MGGDAIFAGTKYQAGVIAFVYLHILAQMRLGWLGSSNDTPMAVHGETGGPGDDARIEFVDERTASVEVQAKHGLTAGGKLDEALLAIRSRSTASEQTRVVLAVNRNSSRKVHKEFKRDLDRLRSGRTDGLKEEAARLLAEPEIGAPVLTRIFVVPADVDEAHDPEAKIALNLLEQVLEDPSQASAAWDILVSDAGTICAGRLRRARRELAELLSGRGVSVKRPSKDERLHRHLDFTRRLLQRKLSAAVLAELVQLEDELASSPAVDPAVRYRIHAQRAAALLERGSHDEAIAAAHRALEIDANGVSALNSVALAEMFRGRLAEAEKMTERATGVAPEDPSAWAAKAYVAVSSGRNMPLPPARVAESELYRTALVDIAYGKCDWRTAIELTAALLAEGKRSPDILWFRAAAGEQILDCRKEPLRIAQLVEAQKTIERVCALGHAASTKQGAQKNHRCMCE